MLDLSRSKIVIANEYDVSDFSGEIEEGAFLQGTFENSMQKMIPATGAASTDLFAGISFCYFTSPSTAPIVDLGVVDSSAYTVVLSQIPSSSTAIIVKQAAQDTYPTQNNGGWSPTGSALTSVASGTTLATGEYSISGNVVTFFSDMAGKTVWIQYRYNLTAQQAASYVGDGILPTKAADVTGTVGVIKKGRIYTSMYDTSVDWSASLAPSITLMAGGMITIGGTGGKVNASVYELPSVDSPFLGIDIIVA